MTTTVFFDTETGGVEDRHPTIQIAAVAVDAAMEEVDQFERKLTFDLDLCDPEALEINSYDADTWETEAVPPRMACTDFVGFCRAWADTTLVSARTGNPYNVCLLAGHNIATFDIPRVRRAADRLRQFWPACWWYPLDTYHRAFWYFREHDLPWPENFRLETLCTYFEIEHDAHDALGDVRANVELARALMEPVK